MMIDKCRGSKAWLFWTGLFLVGMVVAVVLMSDPGTSQAMPSLNVQVSKVVNPTSVVPGQAPAPLYTVTFSNSQATDVVLDAITDTLPPGFEFISMDATSGWQEEPVDAVEPEIVWAGPVTVPANSALSLVYSIYVPDSVPPTSTAYVNTVVAVADDGSPIGPATASLLVGEIDLSVRKEGQPTRVLNGEMVTYTVVFSNSGYLTGTLDLITDTLDPSLTFVGMAVGSDVPTAPQEMSGTLVWTGAFQLPPQQALTLRYQVQTLADPGWSWPCNQVEASAEGERIGPSEACTLVGPEKAYVFVPIVFRDFAYAWFSISKSAFPTTVTTLPGQVVTYTVTIANGGDTVGVLADVRDTLPSGFTFLGMAAGSDVTNNPGGTTGTITWAGPFNIQPHSQMQVIYRVSPTDIEGQYTNLANVTTLVGTPPLEPASAMVTVQLSVLLEDDFENGIDRWTPFLNYWRLEEGQWYWGPHDGVDGSGALTQDCTIGKDDPERGAEDALMMYLGSGSDAWTDYRVETKLLLRGGMDNGQFVYEGGYPIGLWVRGQYLGDDEAAGNVTGYYVVVGGKPGKQMFVRLAQLQTDTDCWGNACDNPHNLYDFNNPHTLLQNKLEFSFERNQWYTLVVEVRGDHIMAWVDGVLAIDYVDEKEPFLTGTVGFKTFKSWTASFDDIIVTPLND